MLKLYQSNRLERLAEGLAELASGPLDNPLRPEQVVVADPAVGRWLNLQLARQNRISANIDYQLPAGFIWHCLRGLMPGLPEADRFNVQSMQWWLFQRLERDLHGKAFDPLRRALDGCDSISRFALAGEIARTFDQYLVYRPDWVTAWEAGKGAVAGDRWQAALWRDLSSGLEGLHWARVLQQLQQAHQAGVLRTTSLPERVSLFAISHLSPGYLDLLELLAGWIDIHLFQFNPAEGFWGDLLTPLRQGQLALEEQGELYLEVGNPLLASFGQQGRQMLVSLLEHDNETGNLFHPPDGGGILQLVQRDILAVEDGRQREAQVINSSDDSLIIDSCHSPGRAVEVLQNRLLALLEADPDLQPDDILVLTPDMDTYAPHIESVFGASEQQMRIPFSLSTGLTLNRDGVARGLLQLIDLPSQHYAADRLMQLLECAALRRRFGLDEDEVAQIGEWIEGTGIRWGRDAEDRRQLGLPETDQNSWRSGLDRLLLGYAFNPESATLVEGALPFDQLEGADATLLGKLLELVDGLFVLEQWLAGRVTATEWQHRLDLLLERFFKPGDDEAEQLQILQSVVADLAGLFLQEADQPRIDLPLFTHLLEQSISQAGHNRRFLGGGVSFAALVPMRSLPFKVIALLGMDDGVFPRDPSLPGFDLIKGAPRAGDRSPRAEDRYLFLENLLNARQTLYISYIGRDIRDNSPLPPSVLVSELLEYVDGCFVTDQGEPASSRVVTQQPLQPFSQDYFSADSSLPCFSRLYLDAARSLNESSRESALLFDGSLPAADQQWRQIELEELLSFYRNPSRYLLTRRLGMQLLTQEEGLKSRDPFNLDYFQRDAVRAELLESLSRDTAHDQLIARERASGRLPHGNYGERLVARELEGARPLAGRLVEAEALELLVDFQYDSFHLRGRIEGVTSEGIYGYSLQRLSVPALLRLWINHLALNLADSPAIPSTSRWSDSEGDIRFGVVEDAEQRLVDLIQIYWEGLHRPLPFFSRTSHQYALNRFRDKPHEQALEAATRVWSNQFGYAESSDAYHRLVFDVEQVLDEQFAELSNRVFLPLLDCLEGR